MIRQTPCATTSDGFEPFVLVEHSQLYAKPTSKVRSPIKFSAVVKTNIAQRGSVQLTLFGKGLGMYGESLAKKKSKRGSWGMDDLFKHVAVALFQ